MFSGIALSFKFHREKEHAQAAGIGMYNNVHTHTLFELKVICCQKKEGDDALNDDESDYDPGADSSRSDSDNQSSSELLSIRDTNITPNSVPTDIAQTKYHSPILQINHLTTFGKGKNSRNCSVSHQWYSNFPFIECSISKNSVLLGLLCIPPSHYICRASVC